MKPGEAEIWPPKYWKFQLETDDDPAVEIAYTDPRRFGRVRLVDCPGKDIRKHSPLVENGPDPVVDTDIFTEEFLRQKMKSRHVPIKALLLDQATLSGIGNWVGDEVLYQAKLHPEQYCNEFSDEQITKLYESIRYVCQLACDKLGDSDQFPEDWMFHYRWGKGKKGAASHLPNGERLAFLKVGGRTSCYAPDVQKNTGHIVEGVKEEPIVSDDDEPKKKPAAKSKAKAKMEEADGTDEEPKKRKSAIKSKAKLKQEELDEADEEPKKKLASKAKPKKMEVDETDDKPPTKKRKAEKEPAETPKKSRTQEKKPQPTTDGGGSRRSSRLSGKTS